LRPGSSDGLTVDYHGDDDRFAVSLVEIAAKAHRPADGTATMPPPEGAGPHAGAVSIEPSKAIALT
jgi:hypothetical protein